MRRGPCCSGLVTRFGLDTAVPEWSATWKAIDWTVREPEPHTLMRVSVRLFAILRERMRSDTLEVELPGETASVEAVMAAVSAAAPAIAPLLGMTRVAVNEAFAAPGECIRAGDVVALIPPVSGGSGLGPFKIQRTLIDVAGVVEAVRAPDAGAVASFLGTVRSATGGVPVVALEYEAYEAMAVRTLRGIGAEIAERWPGARVAIVHRVGRLEVGEVSVAIAVSSPHRAESFAACRHAIERLKQDVPIWKKEIRADGSIWVGVGS